MNPYKFRKEDLYKFKEAFNIFDIRQTGFLSKEDLPSLLAVLHVSLTNKEIKEYQKKYCSYNNKMRFRDFQALMNELRNREDSEESLKASFENIQEDISAVIPVGHLRNMLMKHGEPFSSEEMDMFLAEADPDKTGFVKYQEFVQQILK